MDCDVLVIGAGVAGLSALRELTRAGLKSICLEARDRIGGRIYTLNDPLAPVPIELGAEFVHGSPPEICELAKTAGIAIYDCGERAIHLHKGKPKESEDAWLLADQILGDMQKAAESGPDLSFAEFLEQSTHPDGAKRLATSYVEGFNAARKEVIGIASLAQDARAADQIGGDRAHRLIDGYQAVPQFLAAGVEKFDRSLRLNTVVEAVEWAAGSATVRYRSAVTNRQGELRAPRVVITVPLGVLQAGAGLPGSIRFEPEPEEILGAARRLRFGTVMRVVLRFARPFWEENEDLGEVGFLLSQEKYFPTWWTTLPVRTGVIVGWSAGPRGESLVGKSAREIIAYALADLGRITGTPAETIEELLQTASFHDWSEDPFSRGAYSYTPVGALEARAKLATPVSGTLFFAGEATETEGHSATVHGAIASGKRAARQVLEAQG